MAAILRWAQTWNGSLVWTQTWGEGGAFFVDAQAPIAMAGSLTLAADVQIASATAFIVEPQAPIGLIGALGLAGALYIRVPWEPAVPLQIATMLGTLTISGELFYSTPAVFNVEPQSPVALLGALGIQAALQIATRFNVDPIAPIGLAGTLTADAALDIGRSFTLEPVAPIAMAGALTLAGDIQTAARTNLEPVAPIALQGVLGLAGDLVYSLPVPFDLEPVAPIAMAGQIATTAELTLRVPFAIEPQAPVSLAGSLGLAGDLLLGHPLELVTIAPAALAGQLGISAALRFAIPTTVPDVLGMTQADAAAAIEAARLVVVVVQAFSSDVPVGSVISQEPAGGSAAFVGDTVTITVSSGSIANDPKLIARRKKPNPNITFKRPKKREEGRAPPAEPKKAVASPLVVGLLARVGLALPAPAPAPDSAPIVPLEAPVVTVEAPTAPPAPELVSPANEPEPTDEQLLAARVDSLEHQVQLLRAELEALRRPPEPVQPTPRDPVHEALHAILPAIGDPVDLDAEPPALPEPEPAASTPSIAVATPRLTQEEIRRENERRVRLAIKRLL